MYKKYLLHYNINTYDGWEWFNTEEEMNEFIVEHSNIDIYDKLYIPYYKDLLEEESEK